MANFAKAGYKFKHGNMTTSATSLIKKLSLLFLIVAGLYFAKPFLMPLTVAAVLATLFLPFCKWMEAKHMPKGLAVTFCLLVLVFCVAVVITLLGWQVSSLTNDVELLKLRATEIFTGIQQYIFDHFGIPPDKQSDIIKNEQPSVAVIMTKLGGSLMYLFSNFILILAYVFLLLYYRSHIRRFFIKLSPVAQHAETEEMLFSIAHVSQQYLLGLSKMILCLWIMYSIGFSIIGVKNFLFFAILCGLLEIVPFIGNITGTTVTVLVAAVQGASPLMLAAIIGTYALIQFIQGWILEPLIVGPQVKINPFTTVIALVLGELLWGIPGIFLAIPVIAMVKIVCDHIAPLKPYGFLIGEIESRRDEPALIRKIKRMYK